VARYTKEACIDAGANTARVRMESGDSQSLRLAIERSLRGTFDPADVLPRLARLARLARPASDDGVFAHQKLAELLVERDPWPAALYVRRALAHRPGDDRLWAVLALCHTLLGNFRAARAAYVKALACAPANPWYAHNLGHLLDVALGQPERAIRYLRSAFHAKPESTAIVASYAHALARAGKHDEARHVLEAARARSESRELDALLRWVDRGAPQLGRRDRAPTSSWERDAPPHLDGGERPRRRSPATAPKRLARVLARGLSCLPLDDRQRERALVLARDAVVQKSDHTSDLAGLAAAVAYAIVYIDHVPLSHAEVAAPFRVGVADLRGRFAALRAELDIIRGDTRYASR
jgi:Flp pilus assembly protein TadD